MPTVRICNFELVTREPREDGSRLLATFDVKSSGWMISGCIVIAMADGRLAALPPGMRVQRGSKKMIWIKDHALGEEFTSQAMKAYQAATGRSIDVPVFTLGSRPG